MNRELKGFMAKYDITYRNLSKELGLSANTIGKKIRNGTFDQEEIEKLISYLRKYDSSAGYDLFFNK